MHTALSGCLCPAWAPERPEVGTVPGAVPLCRVPALSPGLVGTHGGAATLQGRALLSAPKHRSRVRPFPSSTDRRAGCRARGWALAWWWGAWRAWPAERSRDTGTLRSRPGARVRHAGLLCSVSPLQSVSCSDAALVPCSLHGVLTEWPGVPGGAACPPVPPTPPHPTRPAGGRAALGAWVPRRVFCACGVSSPPTRLAVTRAFVGSWA